MKRIAIGFIFLVSFFCFHLSVHATQYQLNDLIPANATATVSTTLFNYNDLYYSSNADAKGNGIVRFGSIHNNKSVKAPVSINILLFNQSKKNIGFLTYCSEKDFDSQYASYYLKGDGYSSFSIIVSKKYFGEGWGPSDVYYIAVMDDNEFCHIGGYDNYVGKTIEEISNKTIEPTKKDVFIDKVKEFVKSDLFIKILIGLGIFIGFVIFGSFLNALYRKMYRKGTFMAYLPITNMYVTMKMVYGKIIALIYLVFLLIAGVLCIFKFYLVVYIMIGLWILSLILVLVKAITKNYDLFYLEPSMNSDYFNANSNNQSVESKKDYSYVHEENEYNSRGRKDTGFTNDVNYSHSMNPATANFMNTNPATTNSTNMNPPLSSNLHSAFPSEDEGNGLFDDDDYYDDDDGDDDSDLTNFY